MATPIKITPTLKGKSSERFNRLINASKNDKVSKEEKDRILSIVEKVLSNNKTTAK